MLSTLIIQLVPHFIQVYIRNSIIIEIEIATINQKFLDCKNYKDDDEDNKYEDYHDDDPDKG
jgi:hypothetical protein